MTLAVEALNRFEPDILHTTRQACEVADAVNNPAFKLMLDTFHMTMEDRSIPDAIRLAEDRIAHFQANVNHRSHSGTGHIDWPAVMRALAQVGYGEPISLGTVPASG
ncbi:TIM barrel protein [Salipiger sp. 1_MG-2023]|uniref:sugar phosphate isomerase/epimerase family protein n=1 Tax=Salipiger sp. 1_MG-2023 TaxID=3062665 RepID=UPI0026E455D6|nr:TIM barrel protein [Salipiger sp. 1_MG-2023]MDO6586696.1 TIM barrel protein [Salipiger sp. 1_MG-2023]